MYLCGRFEKMKRSKVLLIVILCAIAARGVEMVDSVWLPEVEVSISRLHERTDRQPQQTSVIDTRLLEATRTNAPKDLSQLVPNVYMPDYGSAMTSSIYIRGLGSRINEPVMGMVVDGVPLMDKNLYDQVLQDSKRIELLRGPQGTLYGRNSPGGVMEIRTIQPLDLTAYSVRGLVSYGSANTLQAQASYYDVLPRDKAEHPFGWGVALRYRRTDGFYRNEYTGHLIDHAQQAGGRVFLDGRPADEWRLTGTIYADWTSQGAFPYASVETGKIAYNRPSSYERLALLPSLRAEYRHEEWRLLMTASYQLLRDEMIMDQDYTPEDIFTLRQTQRQHSGTFDALLQGPAPCTWYDWQVGANAFTKFNHLEAPVTFMREGIEQLILANANKGIQTVFPTDSIEISNTTLPIPSTFDLLNAGGAVFHQSHFHFGKWHIRAGVRIDIEHVRMNYLSTADVNYRFTLLTSLFKTVHTEIRGTKAATFFQCLPRLSVAYEASWGTLYGYAAKGYKAGGYNPQIFSTITQNQVMTDLAADMGMHLKIANPMFSDVSITAYRPEKDWTFEIGGHFSPAEGLKIDVDVFHMQCYDQQVTIFPNGKTSGRLMANAARSRMWGTEVSVHYRWEKERWSGMLVGAYGFTDARFIDFNDGMGDYSEHFIPYSPKHTSHLFAFAAYEVGKKGLQSVGLSLKADGMGRIYWNEQNDCSQPFYGLLGASVDLVWKYVSLQLWGHNLTATRYDVFYFRSMGDDFLQRGKPIELGATLRVEI